MKDERAEFDEDDGDAVNGLGPRDTVVDRRRRESVERVRDSTRSGEPGDEVRCSQEGKWTARLPLERKRETGEGRVRTDPCEARRRSFAGLEPSSMESGRECWERRRGESGFLDATDVYTGESFDTADAGQYRPLHCQSGFIQVVGLGGRATAAGMDERRRQRR